MGLNSRATYLVALWTSHLFLLTAGHSRVNPRIITAPKGERRFLLDKHETLTTLYHEEGNSSLLVGAEGKLYYFDFESSSNHTEDFPAHDTEACQKPEEKKNYLTFIGKYNDMLLLCGTNACKPTCWNLADRNKDGEAAQGLAPFVPNQNSLVLVDGKDIYSTISLHQHNGKIPRFRQVRGTGELYTSDTVMQNPKFVKATVIKQDERHDDKIYYFFQEDNPDKSPEAPLNVSRVAQLCKGDKGGTSSLSASKWTTFLKATLVCVNPATKGNFDLLQDVFIVPSDKNWRETRVYGLFSNSWGYSAVCVYTIGDIDTVFRTSKLKGYTKDMPHIRPGQCPWGRNHTPPETFKIADLHPAVEERVQPVAPRNSPLFHNKNRYQKIAVHRVQARDGHTYNVLYLVTDKGYIHKIVEMPHGVLNILEIQPFQQPAPILAMTLDHRRAKLYVSSPSEVVQLPMDMCEVYHRSCESCVMAKDPYCGWADGKCVSVKANLTMLQNLTLESSPEICPHSSFKEQEVDSLESYRNVTVALFSRYFLYCPTESHAATYKWHHNGSCIQNCSTHWPCFHFIENVTHDRYGRYTCISEENGFSQTLVREWLLKQPKPSQTLRWKSQAVATSPSFWLGFLQVMALALLFQ
ncbi:semaphorin-7A [Chelonia mydas]|uniref:semaphorin-7A n=1 Tax=Chelonia mydas TaxID=8469 RepID=UPI000FFBF6EF|nr:semaphorin-7A [Chelonia mydas]XP_037767335.1 semaphorin-7A [Chelonia mydas]